MPAPASPAPAPGAERDAYHPSTADILAQARRDMPRIERDLRHNLPTDLKLGADTLRYKLEHGVDAAFAGGDPRVVIDFYTAPDNVIYLRATKNGKSRRTMTGGPVSLKSAMGGGGGGDGTETPVNCPAPTIGWKSTPG